MSHNMVMVERDVLQRGLETMFDASISETLLRMFETAAQRDG